MKKRIVTAVITACMAPVSYTHLDVYKRQVLLLREISAILMSFWYFVTVALKKIHIENGLRG